MKLNFHKAFDSISWSYLEWVLDQMGFPCKWKNWIRSCVATATASILVNGSPSPPFKLQRGLRQGDTLSPFLFDIAVEPLNLLIHKAVSRGLWEGLEVCRNGPKITHLQYADDTLMFYVPNIENLLNLKKSLILFQLDSGLKVNVHKSSMIGINTEDAWLKHAAKVLLCNTGALPLTYLGLPIGGPSNRISMWNPVIARMEKKLASWKGNLLSIGGRTTLIKASLSSIPLYYMSLFPIPKGVLDKLKRIQR